MVAAPAKTSFFAIGALHLPDAPKVKGAPAEPAAKAGAKDMVSKHGVVELMRQRGYKVQRVSANAPVPATAGK